MSSARWNNWDKLPSGRNARRRAWLRRRRDHPLHLRHDGKAKGCARHPSQYQLTNIMTTQAFRRRAISCGAAKLFPAVDFKNRAAARDADVGPAVPCHGLFRRAWPRLFCGCARLSLMRKWDPELAMQLIEREKVQQAGGVPTIAWQLLEHPARKNYDLSSLEQVAYGGAPAAPELVRQLNQAFPKAFYGNGWGMTETSAACTIHSGEDYANRPGSCGPAAPVCDVKNYERGRHARTSHRRNRRALGARPECRQRLLEQAQGDGGDVHRRLGAHRRSGAA